MSDASADGQEGETGAVADFETFELFCEVDMTGAPAGASGVDIRPDPPRAWATYSDGTKVEVPVRELSREMPA